jgi:two-component system, chemotaxis family, protein-glutamate methylesterase/glutaminase
MSHKGKMHCHYCVFDPMVVVVGASAGGVEALKTLVSGFPAEFPGSVFVVLHIGNSESALPAILSQAGPLPAIHPRSGQPIENGVIYVAPPDYHMLLLEPGQIQLSHGPKFNFTRPAINPLFRSAAATYGPAVTGIILSGNLDDGVLGLAEIKRRGGVAIVQDPKTAVYPSMPSCAVDNVPVDYVVRTEDMPALLLRELRDGVPAEIGGPVEERSSDLTCPECRGPITEFRSGKLIEYRCRVGHAYSVLAFAQDHRSAIERKLWEAVLVLEESAEIADRLSMQFGGTYKQQAKDRREQALMIREILNDVGAR